MNVLLLCALSFYVKGASVPVDLKTYFESFETSAAICIKELNLDNDKFGKILTDYKKFPEDDEEFRKFYGCVGDQRNYFLESGALNVEAIKNEIDELLIISYKDRLDIKDASKHMVDSCLSTSKTDKPDNAIRSHNCGIEELQKYIVQHTKSELERANSECTEELKIGKDTYTELFFNNEQFPEHDEEFENYYACLGDKRKYFLDNRKLNLPFIYNQVEDLITIKLGNNVDTEKLVQGIKDNCLATSNDDKPKNAIRAHNCAMSHLENHVTQQIKAKYEMSVSNCIKKLNLDKDNKIVKRFLENMKFPEDDKEFSAFFSCVGDQENVYLENGEINLLYYRKNAKIFMKLFFEDVDDLDEIVEKILVKCFSTSNNNKPMNAIKAHNCAISLIEEHRRRLNKSE